MAGSLKLDRSQHHSADKVLAYIAVGDKDRHGVVVPTIVSPLSGDNRKDYGRDFSPRRKKKCLTRQFSKAIKSVLFETTLIKRIRSRKSRKNSFETVDSANKDKVSSLYRDNLRAPESPKFPSNRITKSISLRPQRSASASHLPPLPVCPKCSSSPISKPSVLPRESALSVKKPPVRHHTAELDKERASYIGLCLLLVILFALVFWGKICAIFCGSTWLFSLPHYSLKSRPLERPGNCEIPGKRETPDSESVNHKKMVVMKGLPEQNRRRNTHTASFWPAKILI